MFRVSGCVLLLFLSACGPDGRLWRGEPPAATNPALGFEAGMPLERLLDRTLAQLDSAIDGQLEDDVLVHVRRAESLTDRLPEARAPFEWLAEDYRLEARLWQIQARADRLIAQIGLGMSRETLRPEADTLRMNVIALREALTAGGTAAPPTIDRLLLQLDTTRR